jgi:hypothetical protein
LILPPLRVLERSVHDEDHGDPRCHDVREKIERERRSGLRVDEYSISIAHPMPTEIRPPSANLHEFEANGAAACIVEAGVMQADPPQGAEQHMGHRGEPQA